MSTAHLATALVVPFEELRMSDVEAVGGKNASLGEMISQLTASGVRVPVLEKWRSLTVISRDRYGIMGYSIGALKALSGSEPAHYRLKLDGQSYETQGFTWLVDNAGNIGLAGLGLKSIQVDDGLLDVIIVRDARSVPGSRWAQA